MNQDKADKTHSQQSQINSISWLGIFGLLSGTQLVLLGLLIIWYCEKNVVNFIRMINAVSQECVTIDPKLPDDKNDKKLVYATGKTTSSDILIDSNFEVRVKDAYRLIRSVEMY